MSYWLRAYKRVFIQLVSLASRDNILTMDEVIKIVRVSIQLVSLASRDGLIVTSGCIGSLVFPFN